MSAHVALASVRFARYIQSIHTRYNALALAYTTAPHYIQSVSSVLRFAVASLIAQRYIQRVT
jgi:hypothetical protein